MIDIIGFSCQVKIRFLFMWFIMIILLSANVNTVLNE